MSIRDCEDPIEEAMSHLAVAIMQSIETDDQIIMQHVRDAHALLRDVHRANRRAAAVAQEAAWRAEARTAS